MNNLLSYCGLVDARISASEKNLPVSETKGKHFFVQIYSCNKYARYVHYLLLFSRHILERSNINIYLMQSMPADSSNNLKKL